MKMGKKKKVFRSRISVLIFGFILAVFIPSTIPMIKDLIIPGLCVMGGTIAFIISILSGIRYAISEDMLYIKIWMFPIENVKIMDITLIKRSYNPLSSPASSLKRLQIDINKKSRISHVLISPVREQEFIEELKAVNPHIDIQIDDKKGIWRMQDWDI